ncbi:MAG TPA: MerR family transcriptional regulator [Acidobacteriota bacterium]|nr:MerR family transcriptional regulator [Acidobacteriota bacterium]
MGDKERIKYHSIGEVAKLTSLPAYTIRYWEQEFPELRPRKSRTGRRLYTDDDLDLVRRIKNLLHEQGYTIRGARELLTKSEANPNIVSDDREARLVHKLHKLRRQLEELQKLLK